MRDDARRLVRHLGERVRLPALELDESGYCCVIFDGIEVDFEHEAGPNRVVLSAKVHDAPVEANQRFLEEVLDLGYAAMLVGGGGLGLDQSEKAIVFTDRIVLRMIDYSAFEQAVETFVNRAEGWSRFFGGAEFARLVGESLNLTESVAMMRI
jgi:hypothetical protein